MADRSGRWLYGWSRSSRHSSQLVAHAFDLDQIADRLPRRRFIARWKLRNAAASKRRLSGVGTIR